MSRVSYVPLSQNINTKMQGWIFVLRKSPYHYRYSLFFFLFINSKATWPIFTIYSFLLEKFVFVAICEHIGDTFLSPVFKLRIKIMQRGWFKIVIKVRWKAMLNTLPYTHLSYHFSINDKSYKKLEVWKTYISMIGFPHGNQGVARGLDLFPSSPVSSSFFLSSSSLLYNGRLLICLKISRVLC